MVLSRTRSASSKTSSCKPVSSISEAPGEAVSVVSTANTVSSITGRSKSASSYFLPSSSKRRGGHDLVAATTTSTKTSAVAIWLRVIFAMLCLVWTVVLWHQHAVIQQINNHGGGNKLPSEVFFASFFGSGEETSFLSWLLSSFSISSSSSSSSLSTQYHHHQNPSNILSTALMTPDNYNDALITLNGHVLSHRKGRLPSASLRCIGGPSALEGGQQKYSSDKSWMSRSCHFENMCYQVPASVGAGAQQQQAQKAANYLLHFRDLQSDVDTLTQLQEPTGQSRHQAVSVAMGGLNPRWGLGKGFDKGFWKLRWFPTVLQSYTGQKEDENVATKPEAGYYVLPDNVVWVPFHSLAGHNVGHLLWDDWFAIYSLLDAFAYTPTGPLDSKNDDHQLWLTRHALVNKTLYASCDIRRNKQQQCKNNFDRFLPLMGVHPFTFSSQIDLRWADGSQDRAIPPPPPPGTVICAKNAMAGLGLMTDHGWRDHGWDDERDDVRLQSRIPHNVGRGPQFYQFRTFMLKNMIIEDNNEHNDAALAQNKQTTQKQYNVRFSLLSSRDWDRRLNFTAQIDALAASNDAADLLQQHLAPPLVESYTFWNMTLEEQLEVAATTDILVTTCGGGSILSTFLPRGASLIVFYNPEGGFDYEAYVKTNRTARLDWDLLHHAATHLRVHWFPVTDMDHPDQVDLFVKLVQHELAMRRQFAL